MKPPLPTIKTLAVSSVFAAPTLAFAYDKPYSTYNSAQATYEAPSVTSEPTPPAKAETSTETPPQVQGVGQGADGMPTEAVTG